MNIYEKMAAITAELKTVQKKLSVGEGKMAYKAVGELEVLNAVKPLEEKYKVYSYPVERDIIKDDPMADKYNNPLIFMRLKTVYRFINIENPSEFIDITSYGDGIDSRDKATGKAMTYSDKYALMKAYKISTGEDPDQEASEETKAAPEKMTPEQFEIISAMNESQKQWLLKTYSLKNWEDLDRANAENLINKMNEKKGKKDERTNNNQ